MSTGASFAVFFSCFLFPIVAAFIVLKNSSSLKSFEFQRKYGTLVENLRCKEDFGMLWNVIGIIRIMITVFVLILVRDYPT